MKCYCKWAGRKAEGKDEERGLTFHASILLLRENCTSGARALLPYTWLKGRALEELEHTSPNSWKPKMLHSQKEKMPCCAESQHALLDSRLKCVGAHDSRERCVVSSRFRWEGRAVVTSTLLLQAWRENWCFSHPSIPLCCQRMQYLFKRVLK